MDSDIRVRFAPSPTGLLHVGGARTALFNWLFAKHSGGSFILRIEDTDRVRSTDESASNIFEGLGWLGLEWDEGPQKGGDYGPYTQTERLKVYRDYAEKLLAEKAAYFCYCTEEELSDKRKRALEAGKDPGYDRRCLNLSGREAEDFEKAGRKKVLRFKAPDSGVTAFTDIVRGEVEFKNHLLDDFIILKSDWKPTFVFANVIDDTLMEISHVIRGDEHLSNTPRQILLYDALGFKKPEFAHLPMILGSDGAKLSKRHGATSVDWFIREGFLPDAFINYVALLGWGTPDSRQIFSSREEMIEEFSLERVSKNPAVFDIKKLEWMNGLYLRKLDVDELAKLARPYLVEAGFIKGEGNDEESILRQVVSLGQKRIKKVREIIGFSGYFFLDELTYDREAVSQVLRKEGVLELLESYKQFIKEIEPFDVVTVEKATGQFITEKNLKAKELMQPVRVAITGKVATPGLFEVMVLLGKEKVIRRISESVSMFNRE